MNTSLNDLDNKEYSDCASSSHGKLCTFHHQGHHIGTIETKGKFFGTKIISICVIWPIRKTPNKTAKKIAKKTT